MHLQNISYRDKILAKSKWHTFMRIFSRVNYLPQLLHAKTTHKQNRYSKGEQDITRLSSIAI